MNLEGNWLSEGELFTVQVDYCKIIVIVRRKICFKPCKWEMSVKSMKRE
jgi:hypothetical protein